MSTYIVTRTEHLTLVQVVGRRVRQLRKDRDWTMEDLAIRLGKQRGFIGELSRIEAGRHNVTLQTLQRLADAFDVAPRDLLP
jgi:transcriptional regulator with XRE-family HTH domain